MVHVVFGLRDKLIEHVVHSFAGVNVAIGIAMMRRTHNAIVRVAGIIRTVKEIGIK